MDELTGQLSVARINPGDVLVFFLAKPLNQQGHENVERILREKFGALTPVLILDEGARLAIVRPVPGAPG